MNAVQAMVTYRQKILTVTSYMNTPILLNRIYPTINSGLSGAGKRHTLLYRKTFTSKLRKITTSSAEKVYPPLGTLAMHKNGDTIVMKATNMTNYIYRMMIKKIY